jgi:hypothetical protein
LAPAARRVRLVGHIQVAPRNHATHAVNTWKELGALSFLNQRPIAATAVVAGVAAALGGALTVGPIRAHAAAATQTPPRVLTRRMRPRLGAVAPGTRVNSSALFGNRVFANAGDGFALARVGSAQYPARSTDGGQTWRIDGPQLHVDAADGPEAVGYVGVASARTFFAYGSSVVDVTANGGRTWWEAFMSGLVMAVAQSPRNELVAYVQQSVSNDRANPAVTQQYVSRDGGRHWRYSTALGG